MAWMTLPPRSWFIRKAAPSWASPDYVPPTPKLPTSDWQFLLNEADAAVPQMQAALEHAFTWEQLPMDVRLAILDGNASAAVTHLTTALEGALAEQYLPSFTAIAEDLFQAVVAHQTPYALDMFNALKPAAAPMTTHFADDLLAPRAIEYIQQEGLKQLKGFVTTSMEGIRPILMQSIADGTPIPKVVQQITPLLALGPHQVKTLSNYTATIQGLPQEQLQAKLNAMHVTLRRRRARVIARTETLRALNVGIDAFWQVAPLAAGLPTTALRRFWMITNDSKTCPHCQPIPGLNPQGVGLDEPFKTPQGPTQRPPLHPQCVPGDARVQAWDIQSTSQRWYVGEMVRLRTQRGDVLTCTPNHPVLTEQGWIAAGRLVVGGYVGGARVGQRPGMGHMDRDNRPPRMADIVQALRQTRGMAAIPVPVAAEDFHGDGGNSKVAVIRSNGLLRDDGQGMRLQHLQQELFARMQPGVALDRLCDFHARLQRFRLPLAGAVGRRRLPLPLLGRHRAPFQPFSLAAPSERDPAFTQAMGNDYPFDAQAFGESLDRLACQVVFDQLIDIQCYPFHGWVYNLQTESEWYICNGIITHNCRCVLAVRPTVLAAPELLAPKPMPSTPLFPEYVPEPPAPPPPPPVAPPAPKVKKPPKAKAPIPYSHLSPENLKLLQAETKEDIKYYTLHNNPALVVETKLKLKQVNAAIKAQAKAQMVAPPTPSAPTPPPAPDPFATLSPMQLAQAYEGLVQALNNPALQAMPNALAQIKLEMQQVALHLKAKGGTIPAPAAPAPPPPAPAMVSQSWGPSDLAPAWASTPAPAFWAKTKDVDVGPVPPAPSGKLSTGVVMIEDGKVWVYEPKNHYGGYSTAFPKGTQEAGLSGQQNALKEAWEETGLHAKITGFLGDFTATSGTTRLYLGQKIGGNPTKFGDETWSVKLLTPDDLYAALETQGLAYPKAALQALIDKGVITAPTGYTPPQAPPGAVPPPQVAAPPPVAPAPAKLPNSTAPIEEADVRGEFIKKLGGSTGAELWRGTDGKLRAIKQPVKDQAYQEVLANRLYRELGIEAPAQQLVMKGGKIVGVASDWVDGTQTLSQVGVTKERADKILEGFAADVWLANRDSIGLTMDNILVTPANKLIRIDNGGALQYRAQGTPKPKEWLGKLDEWAGSSNPQLNASYAAVFREAGLKSADAIASIKGQIQQILDLRATTNNYADLVPEAPGITAAKRKELVKLLQDRASLLEHKLAELSPQLQGKALEAALKQVMGGTYDTMARQSRGRGPQTMDEHERVAVYAYTTEDGHFSYHTMNPVYHKDWTASGNFQNAAHQASEKQRLEPLNQSAIDGLAKLPGMKKGTIAYHGQRHMTEDQLAAVTSKGEFTFEAFASTSTKESVTYSFGGRKNLFIIKSLGGNRDVRSISAYSHEAEFLYPPTARFRMIEDYWNGTQHVYKVEELPPVKKREDVQKQEPAFEPPDMPPWTKWVDEYGDVHQMAWGDDAPAGEFAAFAEALLERANTAQLSPEDEAMVRRFARKMDSAGLYVEGSPAFEPPPEGEPPPTR